MKNNMLKRSLALIVAVIFLMTQCFVFADSGVLKRSEVKAEDKWRLDHIYGTKALWEKDFVKVQKEYIPKLKNYKGQLNSEAKILEYLKLNDQASRIVDKLNVYAYMNMDQDNGDSAASELAGRIDTLGADFGAARSFFEPEILSKSDKTIKSYMNNVKFKDYKYCFELLLKQKAHTLSKAEEELLALASDFAGSPEKIRTKAATADLKYPTIKIGQEEKQLTNGLYSELLENPDRNIRKEAFEKVFGAFDNIKNTLAETLNAEVKGNVFYAKARKYNSALEASVSGSNIPPSVYNNLVKAVNNNVDSLHKYVSLRKKVLGVDKIHLYDMYVPLVDNYTMTIKYDEAQKMILDGLKPLGKEYLDVVKSSFNAGWIDVYETENKTTGAYSWGCYDSHPYMLLNYNDTADAMLTLSHEMGHSMHTYYTNKNQKYVNSNYTTFVAEVASTTNELIMTQYLLNKAKDNKEKLYLLNSLIENIRGSVYTQIMYAEFEKAIHEKVEKGEALSTDSLRATWKALMEKYYGSDFVVDPAADLWWARVPHFYYNFYVYQYATGMAAAYPLSQGLSKGEKGALDKYIGFLKAGNSEPSIDILKKAGVDMASTKPVDELLSYFDKLVDEMEKILIEEGKISK